MKVAHYCLHEMHILPSEYVKLPRREKAFITASVLVRIEAEKRAMNK